MSVGFLIMGAQKAATSSLAAALAAVNAFHPLGPPIREERAVGFGKAALVGNSADMLMGSGRDALVAEDTSDTTYANQLVVRAGDEDDPRLQKLLELLTSEEVRQYIDETYEGAVVAAF